MPVGKIISLPWIEIKQQGIEEDVKQVGQWRENALHLVKVVVHNAYLMNRYRTDESDVWRIGWTNNRQDKVEVSLDLTRLKIILKNQDDLSLLAIAGTKVKSLQETCVQHLVKTHCQDASLTETYGSLTADQQKQIIDNIKLYQTLDCHETYLKNKLDTWWGFSTQKASSEVVSEPLFEFNNGSCNYSLAHEDHLKNVRIGQFNIFGGSPSVNCKIPLFVKVSGIAQTKDEIKDNFLKALIYTLSIQQYAEHENDLNFSDDESPLPSKKLKLN